MYTKRLRCTKKGCRIFQTIRRGDQCFSCTRLNGMCTTPGPSPTEKYLNLCDIRNRAVSYIGISPCWDVVTDCFSKRRKMGGLGCIVEINECLFLRKRQYDKGRRSQNEDNGEITRRRRNRMTNKRKRKYATK